MLSTAIDIAGPPCRYFHETVSSLKDAMHYLPKDELDRIGYLGTKMAGFQTSFLQLTIPEVKFLDNWMNKTKIWGSHIMEMEYEMFFHTYYPSVTVKAVGLQRF